jgi:hypothetical protein
MAMSTGEGTAQGHPAQDAALHSFLRNVEPQHEVLQCRRQLQPSPVLTSGSLMFKSKQGTMVATFAISVAFSVLAGCASADVAKLDLGTPAEGRFYDRKVLIGANTKFVNVDAGEVIRFVVQEPGDADRSFTWHFDIAHATVGDLSKLAPAGMLDRPVKVVVGPNLRF